MYVDHDAEGDITNQFIIAKTKVEEKHLAEGPKSPDKKIAYISLVENNYNTKSLERNFKTKVKLVSGTEGTIKLNTGKLNNRKFNFGTTILNRKKEPERKALPTRTGRELQPVERNPPGHFRRLLTEASLVPCETEGQWMKMQKNDTYQKKR